MPYKRILTIQDISCVGQCSITVALPVLSACGHETAILPSSILSNHTTGFGGYTFRDLSQDMPDILAQWQKENLIFDAVYTGYMGNRAQIDCTIDIFNTVISQNGLKIVDPAMADHGLLYPGFDMEFVQYMKKLCSHADFLLPNLTEACLLTDTTYTETYNEEFIINLAHKLCETGCKNVIFTGVSYSPDTTGVAIFENGVYSYYCHEKLPKGSHGTGDLFASAFTGALLKNFSTYNAVKIAADYVLDCIKLTAQYPDHNYGPVFEPILGQLINQVNKF